MYKFILYHFAPCPLSRAVRIALKEKDQTFATQEVKPWLEEESLLLVNIRVWHLKLPRYPTIKEERVPSSVVVLCSAINNSQDKLNMG